MPDRILHKRNLTSGNLPTTASLEIGELAINVADGKIHLRRSGSGNNDIVSLVTANTTTTGSIIATSFSGSFSGSGADLSNIPASAIVGLNLSQIASGSVSASISPNDGLQINTNVTATSFTGSLLGTSSWAQNAVTSSYALTASYLDNYIPPFPYTGSAQITGSLIITGSLDVSQGITGSLLGSASYALTASYVDLGSIPLIQPVAEYQILTASISANTPFTLPNGLTYVSSSIYEYIEVFANQSRLSYNIDFIPITTSSIQFTFVVPSGSEMTYKVFRRP